MQMGDFMLMLKKQSDDFFCISVFAAFKDMIWIAVMQI